MNSSLAGSDFQQDSEINLNQRLFIQNKFFPESQNADYTQIIVTNKK
jgi:hypothetical protein